MLADLSVLHKRVNILCDRSLNVDDDITWMAMTEDINSKALGVATRLIRFMDLWCRHVDVEDDIDADHAKGGTFCASSDTQSKSRNSPDSIPIFQNLAPGSSCEAQVNDLAMSFSKHRTKKRPIATTATEQSRIASPPPNFSKPQKLTSPSSRIANRRSFATLPRNSMHMSRSLDDLKGACLASVLLTITQTKFFDNVGSFLGINIPTQSSKEFSAIVRRAQESAARLLTLLRDILSHQSSPAKAFETSFTYLEQRVSQLSKITSATGGEGQNGVSPLSPSIACNLVTLATNCMRAAADCVAEARQALERTGDFTIEPRKLSLKTKMSQDFSDARSMMNSRSDHRQMTADFDSMQSPLASPMYNFTNRNNPLPFMFDFDEPTTTGLTNSDALPKTSMHRNVSFSEDISICGDRKISQSDIPTPIQTATSRSSSDLDSRRTSIFSGVSSSTRDTTSDETAASSYAGSISSLPEMIVSTWRDSKLGSTPRSSARIFSHELAAGANDQVVGGTPRALVEHLIHRTAGENPRFDRAFFLNFKSFMSATELASAFASQYKVLDKKSGDCHREQRRVLELLNTWLRHYWRADYESPALDKLQVFAENGQISMLPSARSRLLGLIDRKRTEVEELHGGRSSSLSPLDVSHPHFADAGAGKDRNDKMSLPEGSRTQLTMLTSYRTARSEVLDFSALEIARQLTIMSSRLFQMITPRDLLSSISTKTASTASPVLAMSSLSTDITNMVSHSILFTEDIKKRSAVLKHWIKVGEACLILQNYDTLMAIMCSINSTAIMRLKSSWLQLSIKTLDLVEELKEVTEFTRNFARLRSALKTAQLPCLPFLGIFLTDLTFIDAGNANTRTLSHTKDTDNVIDVVNFDKYLRTTTVVETVEKFKEPYKLRELPSLKDWLVNELDRTHISQSSNGKAATAMSSLMYQQSLQVEPRDGKSIRVLTDSIQKPGVLSRRKTTDSRPSGSRDGMPRRDRVTRAIDHGERVG